MAVETQPFFDPYLAQRQREIAYDTQTKTADLTLQGQRLIEDQNLFRPYLERRFKSQANQTAGGVAQRGFHGNKSGVMRGIMGDLAEEQAHTLGEFERGTARGLTDVQRAIATLTGRNILAGNEAILQGAGNAARNQYPEYLPL